MLSICAGFVIEGIKLAKVQFLLFPLYAFASVLAFVAGSDILSIAQNLKSYEEESENSKESLTLSDFINEKAGATKTFNKTIKRSILTFALSIILAFWVAA